MKRCTKCREEKALEEFCKHRSRKDGLNTWCRACSSASHAGHYKENSEKCLARSAKWRKNNSEKVFGCSTEYHEKNPLRRIHQGIMQRCYNPEAISFEGYGGKGIGLHGPWHDFETFESELTALIGPRPSKWHSLDRYPFGMWNYEPYNVRWATWKMQQNNRSNTRWLVIDGKPVPLVIAAEDRGMKPYILWSRIHSGWSLPDALSCPIRPYKRKKEAATA